VQAIRVLVAASISGLEPERVAVTDLRDGRVHAGPLGQDAPEEADRDLARRAAHERHLAAKIRQAISFVEGAVVEVTVAFLDDRPGHAADPSGPAGPRPDHAPEDDRPGPAGDRRHDSGSETASRAPPSSAVSDPAVPQRAADANAPAEVAGASVRSATDAGPPPEVPRSAAGRGDPPPAPGPGDPPQITVTVAVPETSLRLLRGLSAGPGGEQATDMPARELLAAHVRNLLPAPRGALDHRIVVTTYPLPAGQGPRRAEQPATNSAHSARGHSLGRVVDATLDALRDGRFAEVPAQAWLAVAAGIVAIGLWFLLREPTAARTERRDRPRRRPAGQMDWDALDSPLPADTGLQAGRETPDQPRGIAA